MIIAVSYKDGEIYEHFGHAEYFAIYTTNNDQTEITGKKVIEVKETGHQAVADLMDENGVEVPFISDEGGCGGGCSGCHGHDDGACGCGGGADDGGCGCGCH